MKFLALALLLSLPVAAQAAPDPVLGKTQFGQCSACHKVDRGGPDGIGPNLFAVFGSKAATRQKKFAYSPQLKASGLTWDAATLDRWLKSPANTVKGNKMGFAGIGAKPMRDNIIAYLQTLK